MARETQAGWGRTLGRWLAGGLLLYGAVGVAVQLRVVGVLAAGLQALGGGLSTNDGPAAVLGLDLLAAHYNALPPLPWLAWLAGLFLLRMGAAVTQRIGPAREAPAA